MQTTFEEIRRTLDELVRQGERILEEYEKARQALVSPSMDLGHTLFSEFAGVAAADLFGSARAGGHVRRFSRSSLKENQRSRLKQLQTQTEAVVDSWIDQVQTFLSGVSTAAAGPRKPDSDKLSARFLRIKEYSKPETRVKGGVRILRALGVRGLLQNEDWKLAGTKPAGLVVSPGQQFDAFKEVMSIMSGAIGHVIIVDPYPGDDTLVAIENCRFGLPVQFLTCPPHRQNERTRFEALARKLMSDRQEIQIRYAPDDVLHDRFISAQNGTWLLGHSIKDLGKKLSMITPVPKEMGEVLRNRFAALWEESKKLK